MRLSLSCSSHQSVSSQLPCPHFRPPENLIRAATSDLKHEKTVNEGIYWSSSFSSSSNSSLGFSFLPRAKLTHELPWVSWTWSDETNCHSLTIRVWYACVYMSHSHQLWLLVPPSPALIPSTMCLHQEGLTLGLLQVKCLSLRQDLRNVGMCSISTLTQTEGSLAMFNFISCH